ncbi:type-2 angiotensin II receptor [Gracilinanus agilis]|uniref:type-2 angiotensin II receptor n=1 Tax=Gracilinanus agilis TaxID=191870 RepID=UPI001CFDB962|nr:type-2 angiotensin II receptor [Gracilinanus agilis]
MTSELGSQRFQADISLTPFDIKNNYSSSIRSENMVNDPYIGPINTSNNNTSTAKCLLKLSGYHLAFIPVLYYIIFVLGLIGNSVVVSLFCCHRGPKKVASIYIFNLAMADLLFLATLPLWATYYSYGYNWFFGSVMCKISSALLCLNMYASVFFITCMSIDRYQAVVYPFQSQRRTPWQMSFIVPLVWGLACVSSLPTFYFRDTKPIDHLGVNACIMAFPPEQYSQWSAGMAFMKNALGFVIPLVFIATCYAGIRKHLMKASGFGKNQLMRDRVLKMAAAVVLAFVICWLPFHVLTFLDTLAWLHVITNCDVISAIDTAMPFGICMGFANSCINPFLYCFVGNQFQERCRRLFKLRVSQLRKNRDSMSSRKGNSLKEVETLME